MVDFHFYIRIAFKSAHFYVIVTLGSNWSLINDFLNSWTWALSTIDNMHTIQNWNYFDNPTSQINGYTWGDFEEQDLCFY